MKKYIIAGSINFFIVSLCFTQIQSDAEIKKYTSNLPFSFPEIQLPKISNYAVNITEFDAVGDGQTMNTKAFATAIKKCSEKGGGIVTVSPGVWLTGPIRFESNITLNVETGAIILFSNKFEDYPMFARSKSTNVKCVPMIYGNNLQNISITGKGIINGNGQYWRPLKKEKTTDKQWKEFVKSGGVVSSDGKMWWPSKEAMNGDEYVKNLRKGKKKPIPEEFSGAREFLRPPMVVFENCNRILLDGPTFTNSPGWTLQPTQSENVVIRNVSVLNPWWGQNTDGIDINSCNKVLIYNTTVDVGDDAICIKPGKRSESRSDKAACENIIVADCIVYHGHGGFVIGSESYGDARNISVSNCTFIGTDVGLRFKSAKDRGGLIEKIFVDRIQMKDIANEAILFDMVYDGNGDNDITKQRLPQFRDFTISNIVCDGASSAILIRGIPEMAVQNIQLSKISIVSEKGIVLQNAEEIKLQNIQLSLKSGPAFTINNAANIHIRDITIPQNTELFLTATGKGTANINFLKIDSEKAKRRFEISPEVNANSIVVQ